MAEEKGLLTCRTEKNKLPLHFRVACECVISKRGELSYSFDFTHLPPGCKQFMDAYWRKITPPGDVWDVPTLSHPQKSRPWSQDRLQ